MKPGWYWYRAAPTHGWVVLWIHADGTTDVDDVTVCVADLPGEWRGPITQPEDWALAR